MKYLSEIIGDKQTQAFNDAGAFFAFGNDQFAEGMKEQGHDGNTTKMVALGAGLYCPKDTARELVANLDTITADGIKEDIAQKGMDAVILRELRNHEAFYTGDIDTTIDALQAYPCTDRDIAKIYAEEQSKEEMAF